MYIEKIDLLSWNDQALVYEFKRYHHKCFYHEENYEHYIDRMMIIADLVLPSLRKLKLSKEDELDYMRTVMEDMTCFRNS